MLTKLLGHLFCQQIWKGQIIKLFVLFFSENVLLRLPSLWRHRWRHPLHVEPNWTILTYTLGVVWIGEWSKICFTLGSKNIAVKSYSRQNNSKQTKLTLKINDDRSIKLNARKANLEPLVLAYLHRPVLTAEHNVQHYSPGKCLCGLSGV